MEPATLEDYARLGCTQHSSPAEVKAQYRTLGFQAHPDRGGSAEEFHLLKQAYDRVLAEQQREKCPVCKGVGKTTQTKGFTTLAVACPACGETGLRWP